jgi:hypothetical protein
MALPAAWIGNEFATWAIHGVGFSSIITMIPDTLDFFLMQILNPVETLQSIPKGQFRG